MEIPKGMHVLHSCDCRACINPAHLRLGTHQENMQDAVDRGRIASGENSGVSKLTGDQVEAILRDKESSDSVTADKYGVVDQTIRNIRTGRRWKQLVQDRNLEEFIRLPTSRRGRKVWATS